MKATLQGGDKCLISVLICSLTEKTFKPLQKPILIVWLEQHYSTYNSTVGHTKTLRENRINDYEIILILE